jgi:hypothetical protein
MRASAQALAPCSSILGSLLPRVSFCSESRLREQRCGFGDARLCFVLFCFVLFFFFPPLERVGVFISEQAIAFYLEQRLLYQFVSNCF